MSKAFDCVNHDILLDKFEKYGIRGDQLIFLKSYLTDRKQRVKIGEKYFSKTRSVSIGVPQGSCLGPFLYLIYCNDLNNVINDDIKIVNYADDIALVINGVDLDEMIRIMNRTLHKIALWCKFNKLTINPNKSICLIFTNRIISTKVELFIYDQ